MLLSDILWKKLVEKLFCFNSKIFFSSRKCLSSSLKPVRVGTRATRGQIFLGFHAIFADLCLTWIRTVIILGPAMDLLSNIFLIIFFLLFLITPKCFGIRINKIRFSRDLDFLFNNKVRYKFMNIETNKWYTILGPLEICYLHR